jgi:MFS family permease
LPRVVVALGVVSLLTDAHSEMIVALLPVFVSETLHGGALAVGLMDGLADLVGAVVRVLAGRRSDRTGRRKPLTLLGYAASTAAKGAYVLAQGAAAAVAIRVSDRVGKGLRNAPRDALIADAVPPQSRGAAFGFHRAMDTAGAFLGVAIGLLLVTLAVPEREVMALALVPGVLAVVVLALRVREEPRTPADPAPPSSAPAPAARETVPLGAFLAVAFLFGVANASAAFFLLRAHDVGADRTRLYLLYLAYNAVSALAPWPLGRLADRVGRVRVLAGGYLVAAGALVCAAAAERVDGFLWGTFALSGLAVAVTDSTPRAIVAEALGKERRGTALGLHHGVAGLAALASGVAFGLAWDRVEAAALFGPAAGLAAACSVALLLARRRAAPTPTASPR